MSDELKLGQRVRDRAIFEAFNRVGNMAPGDDFTPVRDWLVVALGLDAERDQLAAEVEQAASRYAIAQEGWNATEEVCRLLNADMFAARAERDEALAQVAKWQADFRQELERSKVADRVDAERVELVNQLAAENTMLRTQVAAMRDVVKAAQAWRRWWHETDPGAVGMLISETELARAVDAYRSGQTAPATAPSDSLVDALYVAWTIIANAGQGDWTRESAEWQQAAAKWRDEQFHPLLKVHPGPPESPLAAAVDAYRQEQAT